MRYGNPSKKTRTVSTLKGHTLEFPGRGSVDKKTLPAPHKDHPERATVVDTDGIVYIWVPATVRGEVDQAGMQPESEIEEIDEPAGAVRPEDPEAMKKAAFDAFEILSAAGDRESFGGNGAPKAAAVAKLLGYALTSAEIKDLWPQYQLAKQDA